MAEAVKVIRIELRGGGGGSSGSRKKKERKKKKIKQPKEPKKDLLGLTRKQNLAAAGAVTTATQLVSELVSIGEILSYNSEEKTNMMVLDIQKKAISTTLVSGGYMLGGPLGAAVGMALNQFVINPIYSQGKINIQRNLDQTRATNRFYMTDFAGKGNYTFDYANSNYINEDLEKVRRFSFYKKGGSI